MVDEAHAKLGGLDGLVLNVGIGAGGPWLEGTTRESWDKVFAINLTSHMLSVKAAWPRLSEGASIVFISSIAGLTAGSRLPAYDASKSALFGLCRHVAFEGARRGIRANVVAPGLMDTSIGRLATRGRPNRAATNIPLGRQGTGWETAYAALFLISRRKRLHHRPDAGGRWRVERIVAMEGNAMTLIVYEHPLSPYAQKVKIALDEKGVAYEAKMPVAIGSGQPDREFLKSNPRGEVPSLIDGEVSIFDSTIIVEYIEDKWPEPALLPERSR